MNERIKALADQAAKYAATAALPTGKSGDELFVERFSELIIHDCVACCLIVAQAAIDTRGKEVDTDFRDEAGFNYWHGREDAASLCKTTIRKHFGEGK
jgi:hypothetical protein